MKSKKFTWIGKAVSYLLVVAFVVAIGIGLGTMAYNDSLIVPEEEANGEVIQLEHTDLGDPAMEAVAENEGYILYADKRSGEIAVFDRAKETMWYSNPQDRNEDTLCYDKSVLASQLMLSYVRLSDNLVFEVGSMYGSAQVSGVTASPVNNGIEFTYDFPELGFNVPLTYALTDTGFTAQIDATRIKETMANQYKLLSISVLPYYGAGGLQDEGYLFVPDGSGALIEYNNGKQARKTYSATVYGVDNIEQENKQAGVTASVRMPVFGSKTGNVATLSVITEGEAMGKINASVSGRIHNYNQVYAEMVYRRCEVTRVTKGSKTYNMSQYTDRLLNDEPFTIQYFFLYDTDADYSGMARCYREYLLNNKQVNRSELINEYTLLMELYGAVQKKEDSFSLKADTVLDLTTYAQAAELCQKLQNAGVDITLSMKGWTSGGLGNTTPDKFTTEKVLGGKEEFDKLVTYLEEQNVTAFFEQDFIDLYKNSGQFTTNRDSISLLIGSPLSVGRYQYENYLLDEENSWFFLTPACVQKAVKTFIGGTADMGIRNVALGNLGNTLYSDYSKIHYTTRERSQTLLESAINDLSDAFDNLLVSDANAYTFKTAGIIADVPVVGSQYDIADASVPFYQMVLHGLVPMTVPSCNLSSDSRYLYLKAAETGCLLKYSWIAGDAKELMETDYNNLFGIGFDMWFESATTEYKTMKEKTEGLSALQIVRHEKVADGVFKTTYEDNTCVVVNYNETAVTYGDRRIAAEDFEVMKEEGESDVK